MKGIVGGEARGRGTVQEEPMGTKRGGAGRRKCGSRPGRLASGRPFGACAAFRCGSALCKLRVRARAVRAFGTPGAVRGRVLGRVRGGDRGGLLSEPGREPRGGWARVDAGGWMETWAGTGSLRCALASPSKTHIVARSSAPRGLWDTAEGHEPKWQRPLQLDHRRRGRGTSPRLPSVWRGPRNSDPALAPARLAATPWAPCRPGCRGWSCGFREGQGCPHVTSGRTSSSRAEVVTVLNGSLRHLQGEASRQIWDGGCSGGE